MDTVPTLVLESRVASRLQKNFLRETDVLNVTNVRIGGTALRDVAPTQGWVVLRFCFFKCLALMS